jgi:hypothetical protein
MDWGRRGGVRLSSCPFPAPYPREERTERRKKSPGRKKREKREESQRQRA